jgi:hypothetical protein
MSLSSFNRMGVLNHQIPSYAEYAQLAAPNAAGQAITANTETTLTLDTEVVDGDSIASINLSNQIIVSAGTYVFAMSVPLSLGAQGSAILILRDVTNNVDIINETFFPPPAAYFAGSFSPIPTAYRISATTTLEARVITSTASTVGLSAITAFTLATALKQRRTQVKMYRYKETITQSQVKIGGGNSWSSYAELRNMVALNVAGQAISADTMTTVQLTEKTTDPDGFVTLAANQFVLGAGTYYVEVDATSVLTGGTNGSGPLYYRIQNITDGSIAIVPATGTQTQTTGTPVSANIVTPMESFNGVLVLSGSKTFELQVCCDVGGNLGSAISATLNTASSNCLARVKIYKR